MREDLHLQHGGIGRIDERQDADGPAVPLILDANRPPDPCFPPSPFTCQMSAGSKETSLPNARRIRSA